jgi:protease I
MRISYMLSEIAGGGRSRNKESQSATHVLRIAFLIDAPFGGQRVVQHKFFVSVKGGRKMSKIAVVITDMFEDSEYTRPAEAFTQAGHELTHVGLKAGSTVTGKKDQTPVKIDLAVEDVTVEEFDALLIPGGYSPDKMRVNENAVRFVKEFVESGKPVFSICHAPQLLITADAIRGRRITGWKSIVQDIKNAGAEFVDREVVEDGNLVSSRSPEDLPAFIKASLSKMSG